MENVEFRMENGVGRECLEETHLTPALSPRWAGGEGELSAVGGDLGRLAAVRGLTALPSRASTGAARMGMSGGNPPHPGLIMPSPAYGTLSRQNGRGMWRGGMVGSR
jgi:hypothetical protein